MVVLKNLIIQKYKLHSLTNWRSIKEDESVNNFYKLFDCLIPVSPTGISQTVLQDMEN